ncbi:M20/M25/M40 family metallo-hydrolase [Desulfallas thermosapovorans]|uniref:Tripeptide aminopeptidase n=1 Tax=Desulfallas thermosapovorans DSM 6562 TaxID=1121431 RepID=A0A5S4ZS75_9FIRM|nr:M20/M25/M40 family metallo-hydrolase [Desulfallas thermosapovorans]TYO95601.1 tripeptide aminopeptidase [Desulfallas thermosapovorans DSM 6562]
MINRERLVAEFMEMVQVDSESRREGQMAALLKEKLQRLGFTVHVDEAGSRTGSDTGNLIARLAGNAQAPALMFSAHMDTVTPGCGIKPVEENGVIRSAGDTVLGADDKAGIAAILEAVRVLQEQKLPFGDLELVFTVCEEVGLSGVKYLDFSRLTARMGYVLDSNGPAGTIITRGPSQDEIYAEMLGTAAHAGINPEDGVNAIQVASRAIAAMQLGRIDHETTANIGIISGGTAINIVPEKVTIKGETRSLQEDKRIKQTRAICEALERAAREGGARVQIKVETVYPAMDVPGDAPVVELARNAALDIGLEPVVKGTGGGSDTHIFNEHGIEAVNLGIAMQNVHTTGEFINVDDLVMDASYVLAIIKAAVTCGAGKGE